MKLGIELGDLLDELPRVTVEAPEAVEADTVDDVSSDAAADLSGEKKRLYGVLSDTPVHVDAFYEERASIIHGPRPFAGAGV